MSFILDGCVATEILLVLNLENTVGVQLLTHVDGESGGFLILRTFLSLSTCYSVQ